MTCNICIYLCGQFRRRIRKLQEMCNIVSLVSSVISVKHLVVFPNPVIHWKHAVLILSNNLWLVALTTNTCAFIWTNSQSEVSISDCYTEERKMNGSVTGHSLRTPVRYLPWPLSLFSESDLWTCCVNKSKNCTLFIFLITVFFLFLMMKKLHKTIKTLRVLMQICKMSSFDKLGIIRSISFRFVTWLCEHVHVCMWVCVQVCVEGGSERREERTLVQERLSIYVAIYLNKVHLSVCCLSLLNQKLDNLLTL